MGNETHKYYCTGCKRYIFGDSAQILANNLNLHVLSYHPSTYSAWTGSTIIMAQGYAKPTEAPKYLAAYVGPAETSEWGDAKPPIVTEDDRKLLSKGGVGW